VSLGGAILARGLPSHLDMTTCKPVTCSDTNRLGQNDGVRGLLRLRECSHRAQSSGHAPRGLANIRSSAAGRAFDRAAMARILVR